MTAGLNKETECIRELIDQRLKAVSASELSSAPAGPHIDEDTIAAFVEGRLADDESQPVLAHLAACGSCRRASAQIVQLENQINVEPISETEEPGRLETLLSRFGSLVPSAGEEVVFAYQNPEEEVVGEETTDEADPQSPDGKTTH
ncbi:MAG TPA: zf-HC2 domain-containing protein [Pyrinomonadaceae bacterium]|nr:zf-HC2 domain-containing protein [Pyrinomonadaceae bacterium]